MTSDFLTWGFCHDFMLLKSIIFLHTCFDILEEMEMLWEAWHLKLPLHISHQSCYGVIRFNSVLKFQSIHFIRHLPFPYLRYSLMIILLTRFCNCPVVEAKKNSKTFLLDSFPPWSWPPGQHKSLTSQEKSVETIKTNWTTSANCLPLRMHPLSAHDLFMV